MRYVRLAALFLGVLLLTIMIGFVARERFDDVPSVPLSRTCTARWKNPTHDIDGQPLIDPIMSNRIYLTATRMPPVPGVTKPFATLLASSPPQTFTWQCDETFGYAWVTAVTLSGTESVLSEPVRF